MKSIKTLPKIKRPREKLIKYGPNKLSNSELLAIILSTGTKSKNAIQLANYILKQVGSKNLPSASVADLQKIKGLGTAKATKIVSGFELSKRLLNGKKSTLSLTPKQVYKELKDIKSLKKEHFVVFYLNAQNQEITREIVSIGTVDLSVVHPREVFEGAIKNLATQIIVAHNHPSNDKNPSSEDIKVTNQLVKAGEVVGIAVLDHVIVTKNGYYSFKLNNLI